MDIRRLVGSPVGRGLIYNQEVIVGWLTRVAAENPGAVFLEVGPGGRPLLAELNDVPRERKTAMDLPDFADLWEEEFGIRFIPQNAGVDCWNVSDASIDVVVTNQCLEHIADTDHFIEQVHRVLKPGGTFIVSVPNLGGLLHGLMILFTINPPMHHVSDRFSYLGNPLVKRKRREHKRIPGRGHLRLFLTRAMNDLLDAYGFKIVKNHGGTWGTPILGKTLAGLFPHWGVFTTVMARKN